MAQALPHGMPGLSDEMIIVIYQALSGESLSQTKLTAEYARVRYEQYKRKNNVEDLQEALKKMEQAVAETPERDPLYASRMSNFACFLESYYERTGQPDILERAISKAQQAVDNERSESPDRYGSLGNLANMLEKRYDLTHRSEDLDESILIAQRALDESQPWGPSAQAMCLANLSSKLLRRQKASNSEDLESALQYCHRAANMEHKQHNSLPALLATLDIAMYSKYRKSQDLNDLEISIQTAEEVVNTTRDGDIELPARLNNLGNRLHERFRRLSNTQDLRSSIANGRLAIKLTPDSHSDLVPLLNNLGLRLNDSVVPLDQEEALQCFLRAWKSLSGSPFDRVNSAIMAIRAFIAQKDWERAVDLSKQAIEFLPIANSLSLKREDQQNIVERFSGLASEACSIALESGQSPAEALNLLECGRGAILSQSINARNDLDELRAAYPEAASKFDSIRKELHAATFSQKHDPEFTWRQSNRRTKAAGELETCLRYVRQLQGFGRFLMALSSADICKAATEGLIIVVNITEIRSDALVITTTGITSVQLHATYTEAKEWVQQDLTRAPTREERGRKNRLYHKFLSWLWTSCVKVIFEKHGICSSQQSTSIPRVWWMGVGIASYLPFHAAGDHTARNACTMDWAISSYTPTIRALIFARERSRLAFETTHKQEVSCSLNQPLLQSRTDSTRTLQQQRLLMVTMKETPGQKRLPGVEKERKDIELVAGRAVIIDNMEQPSAKEVLSHLEKCDIVHFACHGTSDFNNPSDSHLLLQRRGPSDVPIADRLSVKDVMSIDLRRVRIAYLSACSTAENKVWPLVDEIIHLASGFQIAGYGHVIGTMWPSNDDTSAAVAKLFYQKLSESFQETSITHSDRAVAAALHHSVRLVSRTSLKMPLWWAQFTHWGA